MFSPFRYSQPGPPARPRNADGAGRVNPRFNKYGYRNSRLATWSWSGTKGASLSCHRGPDPESRCHHRCRCLLALFHADHSKGVASALLVSCIRVNKPETMDSIHTRRNRAIYLRTETFDTRAVKPRLRGEKGIRRRSMSVPFWFFRCKTPRGGVKGILLE